MVAAAIAALLAVTVAAFTAARGGTASVARHATVASDSSDLYFSLSDLDAEAARLVLLGSGASPVAGGQDHSGDQIATLTAYNQRTAQVDADLRQLAASTDGTDAATVATLTSGVTTYHQIADAAISLDETASSSAPDEMGVPAGQPAPDAIGYYSRATALMQGELLPTARLLRDDKASALTDAASSAHLAGIVGASASGAVGLLALIVASRANLRLRLWFRRTTNLGVLMAALIALGLAAGSLFALLATARDASAAGSRFTDYLAVTRVRAASYDADGAVTRYLLMPDTSLVPVTAAKDNATKELNALGAAGTEAQQRWQALVKEPNGDIPSITEHAAVGSSPDQIATALARDTGTARGQDAFDFSYYDTALLALSGQRLAAFDAAMSSARGDLSGWAWLPWVLSGVALAGLVAGVRPRFAEYR